MIRCSPSSRSRTCWTRPFSAPAASRCATSCAAAAGSSVKVTMRASRTSTDGFAPRWLASRASRRHDGVDVARRVARIRYAHALMAMFDMLLTNVRIATMRDADGYGVIPDGALGIRDGIIVFAGASHDVPRDATATHAVDAQRRWATPGLVDCHTHAVYAGNRAGEFEQRLEGAS